MERIENAACINRNCGDGLDFRPSLLRDHLQSLKDQGFSQQEAKTVVEDIARRELTYLFLERFAKENLVHFSYYFEGERLLSPGYEALGDVRDRYKAAISERKERGGLVFREEAELEGMEQIRERLAGSEVPRTFVLMSPPPSKSELIDYPQYADYSFYFFGKYDPGEAKIDMFAWRNEKSLEEQRREANGLLGGNYISEEVHPNDFLRTPIFVGGPLETSRGVIADMPTDEEFSEAATFGFEKYSDRIDDEARMLTALIENGASDQVLLDAQLKIEMDFVRWVEGKQGVFKAVDDPGLYSADSHSQFSAHVREYFAWFSTQYDTQKYSCSGCGGSVFGLYDSYGSRLPGVMEFSGELFGRYIPCPNCNESVRVGSEACSNCGLRKSDYDAGKSQRDLKKAA